MNYYLYYLYFKNLFKYIFALNKKGRIMRTHNKIKYSEFDLSSIKFRKFMINLSVVWISEETSFSFDMNYLNEKWQDNHLYGQLLA